MKNNHYGKTSGKNVAVIGAGAAGLVTARELMRAGFNVTIFEQSNQVGGLWVYDKDIESDALGQNIERRIHSSLYKSLRTNLPRDLMAFSDYTFDSDGGGDTQWPRFPHHTQVRTYVDNFSKDYKLVDNIRFNTEVLKVSYNADSKSVTLLLITSKKAKTQESFDAVAICNGHFAKPRVPALENSAQFSGKIIHSHNYRQPEDFERQRVAVFGISASGADIAREIASSASDVYWCGETFDKLEGKEVNDPAAEKLHLFSCPTGFDDNGNIMFKHNKPQAIDTFIYATGYHYDYPFLDQTIPVGVEDNYVSPLYKQIIPPDCPNVGFIGIPFLIIPFPFFEIQARWFTQVLTSSISLPSAMEMRKKVNSREAALQKVNRKQRQYHQMGADQYSYLNNLLVELNHKPLATWFINLMEECKQVRTKFPATFRDENYINHGPSKFNLR